LLVVQPRGDYRFLPGTGELPFCQAAIAQPGFEIARAQLARPLPWREGFGLIERHLAGLGRPRQALCAVELRCAEPYTREGFAAFNVGYAELMDGWGLLLDGGCTTRTNVAPELHPPSEQVLFAFAYTVPTAQAGPPTFVVAGAPERPHVRPGESSPDALREKTADAVAVLGERLAVLGLGWEAATQVAVYTEHDALAAVRAELLPLMGSAALEGLRWFPSRPPILGLEIEIDVRGLRQETRV
jgi:hypothetical protein